MSDAAVQNPPWNYLPFEDREGGNLNATIQNDARRETDGDIDNLRELPNEALQNQSPREGPLIMTTDEDFLVHPILQGRSPLLTRRDRRLKVLFKIVEDFYLCLKFFIIIAALTDLIFRFLAFEGFFAASQIAVILFVVIMLSVEVSKEFFPKNIWVDHLFPTLLHIASLVIYNFAVNKKTKIFSFKEKNVDGVWVLCQSIFITYLIVRYLIIISVLTLFFVLVVIKLGNYFRRLARKRAAAKKLLKLQMIGFETWSKRPEVNEQGMCPICLGDFDNLKFLSLLPGCKHWFHHDCIVTWIQKHDNCPLCKKEVLKHL